MSKSKTKQEEALQLLDDLDSFTPIPPESSPQIKSGTTGKAPGTNNNEGEAEVLAFLDEITQKSAEPTKSTTAHIERPLSRAGTPTLRKSTERVKLGGSSLGPPTNTTRASTPPSAAKPPTETPAPPAAAGGWGWGSVWNTASAALQQARTVVDEQVKHLPANEQARKWGEGMVEYAKSANIDKLGDTGQDFKRVGLSTLTDILNVVAPPIAEHEVIQVWLSHDMKGYDGVENLVYRSMARVMEQVEGGDLVVNRGQPSQPKEEGSTAARDLNAVDGYEAAIRLAQANLDQLIKTKNAEADVPKPSSQSPTSYSHVFLHIQPFLTSYVIPAASGKAAEDQSSAPPVQAKQQHLQFLIYLSDPSHKLIHSTISQAAPGAWLAIWDDYDWVEDLVAESLRVAVEVVAQEYVVSRMGWAKATIGAELSKAVEGKQASEVEGTEQNKTEDS